MKAHIPVVRMLASSYAHMSFQPLSYLRMSENIVAVDHIAYERSVGEADR